MPHLYSEVDKLQGEPPVGSGTCVDLVKVLVPGLKSRTTQSWKPGINVLETTKAGKTIARGTAIATFINGRYPQSDRAGERSSRHAALFLSAVPGGIWVMDQYPHPSGRGIKKRLITIPPPRAQRRSDGTYQDPGNNAMAFYVDCVPSSGV
jgi:hypothetical protein